MNTIESLKAAINDIFQEEGPKLFFTPNEMNRLMHGLDFSKLFSALMDRRQSVYAFCSIGMDGASHQYFSTKLLPLNASLIWRSEPELFGTGDLPCFQFHELWLMEDMSVVATSCFQAAQEPECLASEFREIKGDEWPSYLAPISILEMWHYLHGLYAPADDGDEEESSDFSGPVIYYEP